MSDVFFPAALINLAAMVLINPVPRFLAFIPLPIVAITIVKFHDSISTSDVSLPVTLVFFSGGVLIPAFARAVPVDPVPSVDITINVPHLASTISLVLFEAALKNRSCVVQVLSSKRALFGISELTNVTVTVGVVELALAVGLVGSPPASVHCFVF